MRIPHVRTNRGPFRLLPLLVSLTLTIAPRVSGFGFPDPVSSDLGIPENAVVRESYRDAITGPLGIAGDLLSSTTIDRESGIRVRFKVEEQNGAYYFLFLNEQNGSYPIAAPGTYIVKRDASDGAFVQAKVFLQNDPGSFIRIFSENDQSRMDVYIMDRRLHRSVSIPVGFEELLFSEFSRVIDLTKNRVDWDMVLARKAVEADRNIAEIARRIRMQLPGLGDSDDGALDGDGTFRFIEDLSINEERGFNCSGFAKWVVDGFYYPLTGRYLEIEELKRKHVDLRGNEWSRRYEDMRDPYFGLDWTRNLAVALKTAIYPSAESPETTDVRSVPYFEYVEDIGYAVDDLELILYLLALDNPGSVYLGSVNREFGSKPVLRQHVHVVVLMPYFTESGRFSVAVLERNLETSTDSLVQRYSGDYIHLVELESTGRFEPPDLPADISHSAESARVEY